MARKFSLISLEMQLAEQGFKEHSRGSIEFILSRITFSDFYKTCKEFYIVNASVVNKYPLMKPEDSNEPQFVLYYRD